MWFFLSLRLDGKSNVFCLVDCGNASGGGREVFYSWLREVNKIASCCRFCGCVFAKQKDGGG